MKEKIIDVLFIIIVILFVIGLLLLVAIFALYVYAMIKYGNTPINELPVWVWWLFK